MDYQALIICILSSSASAAIVTAIKDLIIDKRKRQDKKEENSDKKLEGIIKDLQEHIEESHELMANIVNSNKLLMRDRIKFIATRCIRDGEITFEDRKLLHDMWEMYHNAWGGNGDLNLVMENVDELPLKLN